MVKKSSHAVALSKTFYLKSCPALTRSFYWYSTTDFHLQNLSLLEVFCLLRVPAFSFSADPKEVKLTFSDFLTFL
jgi:hypothetical protein